ncbi:tRNA1(Val) (adenine(37)-N6)-methyltransferase [Anaerococcus prevotii]|uniref:Methyltransferase small n=1 Tax=Anaerococcus prevotii (strain ATCC 9321 / DSM 20548 / JCM 6508 / NCTC 11806 / PC1) TaxID=525919 RepID=C7RDB7_ANAPD|nr:methyltransferase [Anaerococcus prevotii]ACV29180.1 methyltransferase small [Anaerococcus prevotii DSM 20548]SUU94854.1 tRNA1(Val) (adenine(37)-N6)-methyltransferase [Anaerococcus prevotii]
MKKLDYLPRTNIKMIHVDGSYSFGVDSIILGDFAKMKKGRTALDIGAGSGVLSFLTNSLYKLKKVYAVEIQKAKADLLRENIALNNIENIEIINDDLNNIDFKENSLDYIITNPPYYKITDNIGNKEEEFLISRQEKYLKLEDIFAFANKTLKDKGKLFMIHKPERMVEIFNKSGNIKPKRVRFVESRVYEKPQFILVEFVKNARDGLKIEDPLVIYEGKSYSKEMKEINDLD